MTPVYNMPAKSEELSLLKSVMRRRRMFREVHSDPVFHLPDQDTSSPASTDNQAADRTLPDVVQAPLAQTRGRSSSVPLSFEERVREAGSILRRVSREFENFSVQSSVSQDRTETLMIQVNKEQQQTVRQRRFSTSDSFFPHQ
ncbi:uncharacterized protein LOC143252242 [Tachypleus tridentatus]|uniref:uncharacterized protein LOC143252242 n=1 Tax=Tachypleus tridentatus TaxID=6853 RepID=UPI003FD4D723